MSADAPIGEDDLNAFVDGRIGPERRALVDRFLAEHPQMAARVAADIAARDALRQAVQFKAEEPIPARLRVASFAVERRPLRRSWLQIAAASIVLVLLGGASGWFAHGRFAPASIQRQSPFAADALTAHRLYVAETVHPVEVAATQEAHLVQWLSRRLNHPLKAPDLTAQSFRLMGGRLLPAESGAAAQFMYQDDGGARLTLYLRADGDAGTAFRFVQGRNVSAFTWTEDGLGYAIAAEVDRTQLLQLAEIVYRQCGSGGQASAPPPT